VLRRVLDTLRRYSIPLIAGVVVAVVWANASPDTYAAANHWSPFGPNSQVSFHFLVNDIFMAIFFGIATKEITESILPGGPLNPPRRAINPLLGTLGGVLGPIGVFFTWVALSGDSTIANGWGIPTATDIAIAWLVARLVFGAHHPCVSYLLLLAVADDGIGLGIIAIFYPDPNNPVVPAWLLLVAAAMAGAYVLRRAGVTSSWAYLVGPGVVSWLGLHAAHLHPALALVAVVPFMPSAGRDEGIYAETESKRAYTDTLNRFEHTFKPIVDFGLFFFGVANAGVEFSSVGTATWGVLLALALGKTGGIFTLSYLADRLGFSLPRGMTPRSLFVAGMVAGIGLTVALFVAGVAFTDPHLQGAAKMGALMSSGMAVVALAAGRALRVARPTPAEPDATANQAAPRPA
jgi:NhaA family Na+:H+ antiporter